MANKKSPKQRKRNDDASWARRYPSMQYCVSDEEINQELLSCKNSLKKSRDKVYVALEKICHAVDSFNEAYDNKNAPLLLAANRGIETYNYDLALAALEFEMTAQSIRDIMDAARSTED